MGVSNIVPNYGEFKMIMKSYVADELSNKVYHLNKALKQAQDIIAILEKENNRLRDVLIDLASLKKED